MVPTLLPRVPVLSFVEQSWRKLMHSRARIPQAVQVRLGGAAPVVRPRLDLVFLVDATGSMDDEIAKLKASGANVDNPSR